MVKSMGVLILFLLPGQALLANTIMVNTTIQETTPFNRKDGRCSLGEAIEAANKDAWIGDCQAGSGKDTIILKKDTYSLSRENAENDGLPVITSEIVIEGNGSTIKRAEGSYLFRLFHISDRFDPATNSTSPANVTLKNLTLRNGHVAREGGAILHSGNELNISDSEIISNASETYGGGIHMGDGSVGTLNLRNVKITNNTAKEGGGGISNFTSTINILNSSISENESDGPGGGIYQDAAPLNDERVSTHGRMFISNSTIADNESRKEGGGIHLDDGSVDIGNVTIARNQAAAGGGGIHNAAGTFNLRNSIVAVNSATTGAPDCSGAFVSEGYNIIGNDRGCSLSSTTGDKISSDTSPIDPDFLYVLYDNGGPTPTMALRPGSFAINAGNPAGCLDGNGKALETDQRGEPRVIGSACDVGAFESDCGDGDVQEGEDCDYSVPAYADQCSNTCLLLADDRTPDGSATPPGGGPPAGPPPPSGETGTGEGASSSDPGSQGPSTSSAPAPGSQSPTTPSTSEPSPSGPASSPSPTVNVGGCSLLGSASFN